MKVCKHCKSEIDPKAKVCPNCRKKQGMPIWMIVILVILGIGIISAALGGGKDSENSNNDKNKDNGNESTEIVAEYNVTVAEVMEEYKENGVASKNKYKGKYVAFTGYVDKVDEDILGSTFVSIDDGGEWSSWGIQCYVSDSKELENITTLKSGEKVTMIGKVDDYSLNLTVKKCFISK